MKRMTIVLLVVATVVLGLPTAVSAGEPAHRFPVPDITVDVINPCNELPVTVTWTDLMLVTRTGQDAHGGTHIVFTLEGSIFDTAGFSGGQLLFTSHANGSIPDTFEQTEHFTVINRNPDTDQAIVLHSTTHINVKDGVATVDISIFDEQCVGKPN